MIAVGRDGYRPYLDGLRAIAVGGVLLYHLDRAWLPGGYLGVDLFFVLSGYLITTLLLSEHRRTGGIDLPAFWSRRVRRLLPALLVVLLVIAAGVYLGGDALAATAVRGDLLSTLFYFANWHFIATDQSYFAQYLTASPVRHAWSLAIEEQFYLVWPLVVAVVVGRLGGRRALAAAAVVLTAASAAALWLLFDAGVDPSRAYYGTDARIYELLVGALLAMALLSAARQRLLAVARPLALPALMVVAIAMLLLHDDSPRYYHGAGLAFAVAGATLIAGLEAGSRLSRLLSLRPLVAIGLISYGIYLWHWPITLFVGGALGPTGQPLPAALVIALTLGVSAASYLWVERPIRRGGGIGSWRPSPRRVLLAVPAVSGTVALAIVLGTSIGTAPIWAGTISLPSPAPPSSADAVPGTVTLGVVGDSVMVSALPGLRAEAARRGVVLVEAALPGCPVGYEPLFDADGRPSSFNERCEAVRAAHDALVASHPDLVLWHDLQSTLSRRAPDGTVLAAGTDAWATDLIDEWEAVLDRLLAAGAEVVIVMPPLRSQDARGCPDLPQPRRCQEIQAQDAVIRGATRAFWSRIHARPGVHLLMLDSLLCPEGYPCPALVDGIQVRLGSGDQTHFSEDGATWLAPRLVQAALEAAGERAVRAAQD
ncbi:MAG TPA: acyltransferase family protein [Candidatus Limnocylindria bacterium]